jgi:hypothetical protein
MEIQGLGEFVHHRQTNAAQHRVVQQLAIFFPAVQSGQWVELAFDRPVGANNGVFAVKQPNDNMSENDSLDGMIMSFDTDNDRIIKIIRDAIKCAGACDEPAVQNFLQDRLDYHQKLSWMLRSIRK